MGAAGRHGAGDRLGGREAAAGIPAERPGSLEGHTDTQAVGPSSAGGREDIQAVGREDTQAASRCLEPQARERASHTSTPQAAPPSVGPPGVGTLGQQLHHPLEQQSRQQGRSRWQGSRQRGVTQLWGEGIQGTVAPTASPFRPSLSRTR